MISETERPYANYVWKIFFMLTSLIKSQCDDKGSLLCSCINEISTFSHEMTSWVIISAASTTFTCLFFSLFYDWMFCAPRSLRRLQSYIPDIGTMCLYVLFSMLLLVMVFVFVKYFPNKSRLCFGPLHKSLVYIFDKVFMPIVCKCRDMPMAHTFQILMHNGWHGWYHTSCLLWVKKQSYWCSSYSWRWPTERNETICWFTIPINEWNCSHFVEI